VSRATGLLTGSHPFSAGALRSYLYVALSAVCLAPLIVLTAVNAALQLPAVFLASLVLYVLVFAAGGARFERWRTHRVYGDAVRPPAPPRRGRTALYVAANVVTGLLPCLLLAGWALLLVRNVVLYPLSGVGEFGHSYPDPSWGGPTWQGAIAVHTGGALLSLLLLPRVIGALAAVQAGLVQRLLG
jgi:hypothetical protein